ncbi:MAG: hypothetical protein ACLU9V_02875 [Roseburia sp.]
MKKNGRLTGVFQERCTSGAEKEQDRKELITAIYLYVYLNRKREEQD